MIKSPLPALSILLLLATTAAAQRRVWIVDLNGGPGVDFTAIQPAIDAASPGDRIEVRGPGAYSGFVLGKGVDLEAVSAQTWTASMAVRAVPAGAPARVAGFSASGIAVEACQAPVPGAVHIRNLQASAPQGTALWIVDCSAVRVSRSAFNGGGWVFGQLRPVVRCERSQVAFQGCNVTGDAGRDAHPISGYATAGGTALGTSNAAITAADSTFAGGNGGGGFADWFAHCVMFAASGGHAIVSDGAVLLMQGCRITNGRGGWGGLGCPNGLDGDAIQATGAGARVTAECVVTGRVTGALTIPGLSAISAPDTAARGQPVTLTMTGVPGTLLMTYLDAVHGYVPVPGIDGPFLLTPFAIPLGVLVVGPGGSLALTMPVPTDPVLADLVVLFQAVAFPPAAPVPALTNAGDLRIR